MFTFYFGGNSVERTLVLVKPDGVQRGLIGEVIARFEDDINQTYRVVVDTENHDVLKVEQLP